MTTLLGTLTGGMLATACPSTEDVDETPLVTVVRTGAGAYSMSAPHRALRSWRLGVGAASPTELASLRGLLRYATLPLVFVSEHAAGVNGLTPAQSAFHPSTLAATWSRSGTEWVRDRWGTWQVAWTAGTTAGSGWLDHDGPPVPVIPGKPVTVSAAMRARPGQAAPRLGLEWVDAAGARLPQSVATPDVSSTTQPLPRVHATFTAPLNAVAARMVFFGADQVAAPAVTLTPDLRPYGEGDGAPQVVPTAASMRHLLLTAHGTYSSHDLVLQEVGRAVR